MALEGPFVNEVEARSLDSQAIEGIRPYLSTEMLAKDRDVLNIVTGGVGNLFPTDLPFPDIDTYYLRLTGTYSNLTPTVSGTAITVASGDFLNGVPQAYKNKDGLWDKIILPLLGADNVVTRLVASQVDSINVPGYYVVDADTITYSLMVSKNGAVIRQIRDGYIPDGIEMSRVRFSQDNGVTWDAWTDYSSLPVARNLDLIKTQGVYLVKLNSGPFYLMSVYTVNETVLQVENQYNLAARSIIPGGRYRRSVDYGVTWGEWEGTSELASSVDINTATKATVYLIKSTISGGTDLLVTNQIRDGKIRQLRDNHNTNLRIPLKVTRDSTDGGTTWVEKEFTYFKTSIDINSVTEAGVYIIRTTLTTGNDYFVHVTNVAGKIRQTRLLPNMDTVPQWVYRDSTDNGVSWSTFAPIGGGSSGGGLNRVSTGENTMWSWWNYPQIIRYKIPFNKFYLGYTSNTGEVGLACKNLDTGDVLRSQVRANTGDIDDHNAGCVIRLSNNKIFTASASGHNLNNLVYAHTSDIKDNIESFTQRAAIVFPNQTTYCQTLYLGGVLYLFTRLRENSSDTSKWWWFMTKSSDFGVTWTTPQCVIYSANKQWYALFRPVLGNDNLIRIVHYSNPNYEDTDIRGGIINISEGNVYDANGTTLRGAIGLENDVQLFTIIVNGPNLQRILDLKIAVDFQILLVQFATNSAGDYKHYDNGVLRDITASGRTFYSTSYFGGCIFGDNNKVYVSRSIGSPITQWFIEEWTLASGAYTKTRDIFSTASQSNSGMVAIRPIYGDGILAWVNGYYNSGSYTDFSTQFRYVDTQTF